MKAGDNNDRAKLIALKNYIENKIRTLPSTAKAMPLDRLKKYAQDGRT